METARAWQVPRSIFLGRVTTPGDPLWTDDDRGWALALHLEEQAACKGCGQPRDVAHAIENSYAYKVVESRCHACAARDEQQRRRVDTSQPASMDGLYTLVELIGDARG